MGDQIDPKTRDFIVRTIRNHLPDAEIFVFGSRITGRAKKYSDLDIALKTIRPISLRQFSKLKEEFSKSDLPFKIDLLDYNSTALDFRKIIDATAQEWQPSAKNPVAKHPWRQCPSGQHWVRRHDRHFPKKSKTPEKFSDVDGHCADNPSHRDIINSDEIRLIADKYMTQAPSSIGKFKQKPGRRGWNSLDALIVGWTNYWNENLNPDQKLDPNIVKALIAFGIVL